MVALDWAWGWQMPRRSGFASALVAGACALLAAAACSATGATSATGASRAPASTAGTRLLAAPATTPAGTTLSAGTTISAGSSPSFTALAFPSPSAGWVLGATTTGPARAQIWHTGTAGKSWQLQWQGAGSPLAITATDTAHAWALIACPAHAACERELLATADGGERWRVADTLPAAVNLVQFYSPSLGLATSDSCLSGEVLANCPGKLLVSRDGGTRWTTVLSGSDPVFGTAAASGQLWAAQTYPAPSGKGQPEPSIKFLTSTDGGSHWRELGSVSDLGVLSPAVRVTLAATAAGLTWATVFDILSCAMHGCSAADLLSSASGGLSWSTVDLADSFPDECGYDGIVLSAVPGGGAWVAAGRNGGACAPPLGLLYRYPGPVTPWQQLTPWQLTQVSALAAVTGREAYAISDQRAVSVTFDGGAIWTQLLPAPDPSGEVDAVTASTALAAQDQAGAGVVLRSANGGRSWSQTFELPGVLTQLDFWSASDGIAATYQPDAAAPWQLFGTSDGGASWAPVGPLPGGNTTIDGPWMTANGHGLLLTVTDGVPWESGSGGLPPVRIWITTDHGLTWHADGLLPLGDDTVAGPASFVYTGGSSAAAAVWTGWIVIDTASFVQRVAAVTIGGPLRLLSSSLPADNLQLLRGGAGFVWGLDYVGNPSEPVLSLYRTTNSGRSWQHFSIRLEMPVNSATVPLLGFSSANDGWLVLGSVTWRTADGGRTWTRG